MKKILFGISIFSAVIAAIYYSYLFIVASSDWVTLTGLGKPLGYLTIAFYLWKTCEVLIDPIGRGPFIKSLSRWGTFAAILGLISWLLGSGGTGAFIGAGLWLIFGEPFPSNAATKDLEPIGSANYQEWIKRYPPKTTVPNFRETIRQGESESWGGEEPRKKALRRLHVGLVSLYVVKLKNQLDDPQQGSDTEKKKESA